jgi:hypothetical protein
MSSACISNNIKEKFSVKSQWILEKLLCTPNVTYFDFINQYLFKYNRGDIWIALTIVFFILVAHNFSKVMTEKFLVKDYLYLIDNLKTSEIVQGLFVMGLISNFYQIFTQMALVRSSKPVSE